MRNDRKRETELSHELPLISAGMIFLSSFLSFFLFFFSCLLPRRRFRFHSGFKISLRDLEANVPQFHLPFDDLDALYKFTRLNFLSEHSREHRVIGKNRS